MLHESDSKLDGLDDERILWPSPEPGNNATIHFAWSLVLLRELQENR